MAAATAVDLVDDLGDFDMDDFDVIQAFDLDLLADDDRELRRGGGGGACYYSAIFSDAEIVSHCRHSCGEDGDVGDSGAAAACAWLLAGLGDGDQADDEEEAGSSPADSGVTYDGMAAEADAEAMSAYVAKLERFLLDDDDDDEQAAVDHQGLLGVVDDYFAGDQLLTTAELVVLVAGRAEPTVGEEEVNGDGVLAAREDDQSTSRKRARNKIKGTAMLTPWAELEVLMNLTMMHLAQIQVPPATSLLLCCAACRMWPSGLIA